ncbi:MAG TPA: hypothetical protein VGC09_16245 [Rhodopila sp.]
MINRIGIVSLSIALTTAMATQAVAGQTHAVSVPGGRVTVMQRGLSTVLAYAARDRLRSIVLPAEEGIYAGSLDGASLVGAVPGRIAILSTTYASRPNGGSHACGAGMETVIRIVVLRPIFRQARAERVDSCWKTMESGRIAWDPAARTLLIETFDGTAVGHAVKIFAVQDDGTVRLRSTTN